RRCPLAVPGGVQPELHRAGHRPGGSGEVVAAISSEERSMIRHLAFAAASIGILGAAAGANAADLKAAPPAAVVVAAIQDCSVFYDDYQRRGFTWGSGPGTSVGMGVFEGALPRYPQNEFPNWYGQCAQWGHYSASGSARF